MGSLRHLDWPLLLTTGVILAAGLLSLSSTAPELFWKQLTWLFLGLCIAAFFIIFDWRPFVSHRGILLGLYSIVIILLVGTLLFAPRVRGAQAWLSLGGLRFQPSEAMKLVLILIYASFFRHAHVSIARPIRILQSFLYALLPVGLVALEPDVGSAFTLFAIWFGFLLVSGIRPRHLFLTVLISVAALLIAWHSAFAPYQKERILGFLFTGRDTLGINYNVIQSKIAIGSAGWWGKGYGQGTQSQLGFLPEAKTDFIFAAFTEEWGIAAGLFLVAAFIFAVFRVVLIGLATHNNFNRFVCLGAVIYWAVQFILNIGSNVGLTPVVGITFPFLSYGGSSLLTNMALLGMLESIAARRSLSA